MEALNEYQVQDLKDGDVVLVLWDGFKQEMFEYRVKRILGEVCCVELNIDGDWRPTAHPLPLTNVTTERAEKARGTVVLPVR